MSETRKDECAECASGGRCANHPECLIPATPPAAETGERFSKRVVRNEPGVTEIHIEAREVVRDGPMRVECWWSEEDGAYLAQLTDSEPESRPFTATHTAHGDTRESALAHLAIGEYVTALAVATPPAAETGDPVAGPSPEALREWAKHVRYGITNPRAPILKLAEFLDALATQAGAIVCANCKGGVVVQELPDSALDVHGLCGYCRRVGIRAEHLAGVSKMMPLARYPYEAEIGSIIRHASDPHPDLPVGSMFTLKCSVGELAQRIASVLAPALAESPSAPREPSAAMAIAAMREFSAQKGESHDAMWDQLDAKMQAEIVSEWQHILRAALSAETGTP